MASWNNPAELLDKTDLVLISRQEGARVFSVLEFFFCLGVLRVFRLSIVYLLFFFCVCVCVCVRELF